MKKILFPAGLFCVALFLGGCLVTPVDKTGGPGSVTVANTNSTAIIAAAQNVFPNYGYTPGPVNYPDSVSFDKPAGKFGKIMYGSYGTTTTFRVKLVITQIPGTSNYRLSPKVTRVSDAGEAGFEDSHHMGGMWSSQFGPLLQQVKNQAQGAGPGY